MKKINIILPVFIFLLIGCGEEFNSSSNLKQAPKDESMNDMALSDNDFKTNFSYNQIETNKLFLTKAKWKNNTIKWWYNPSKQKFKNTTEAISIFKSAMKSWSSISGIKFEYQGTTTTTQFDLNDGKIVFGWADPDQVKIHFGGDGSIGAFVWYKNSGTTMTDVRMTLNTARYTGWNNPYNNNRYVPPVKSWKGLITHELGHVLGIAHSNISNSIMYANPYNGTVYMETLRSDDISAVTELYPKEETEVIKGEFDGAGSLVSPKENCWGCNKDEARMHPHQWTGSTVAFQWLYDKNTCSQIDIYASNEVKVAIKAKPWKEHLTQEAVKVTLGTQAITLKKPSGDSSWTTLAITSIDNIDKEISIKAYCRTPQDIYHKGDRESIETDLVDVTHEYFWTGTASLISRATKITDFGYARDWAVTFRTTNSLTSFQWDTTNCRKVKITNGTTNESTLASVDIKSWDQSNNEYKNKCTSLPCTIETSNRGYFILKVKSKPNAISKGYIQAQCIQ